MHKNGQRVLPNFDKNCLATSRNMWLHNTMTGVRKLYGSVMKFFKSNCTLNFF